MTLYAGKQHLDFRQEKLIHMYSGSLVPNYVAISNLTIIVGLGFFYLKAKSVSIMLKNHNNTAQ